MIQKKSGKIYLLVHIALLAAILAFPLYRAVAQRISTVFTGCLIHDRFFLYCPLCGGTRAVSSLLRLEIAEAFSYNAFVVLLVIVAIGLDVWAFVRLLRGHTNLLPLPGWIWIVFAVLLILYGVLRNYLMIARGVDPVGDLGVFWNGFRQ